MAPEMTRRFFLCVQFRGVNCRIQEIVDER